MKDTTQEELKTITGPTDEEVEQKAAELTEKLKVKVHPFVFLFKGVERIAGYMREPDRITKLQYLDRVNMSPATAGANILEACLIKDASDNRILSEDAENDTLYLGAVQFIQSLMLLNYNVYKKK